MLCFCPCRSSSVLLGFAAQPRAILFATAGMERRCAWPGLTLALQMGLAPTDSAGRPLGGIADGGGGLGTQTPGAAAALPAGCVLAVMVLDYEAALAEQQLGQLGQWAESLQARQPAPAAPSLSAAAAAQEGGRAAGGVAAAANHSAGAAAAAAAVAAAEGGENGAAVAAGVAAAAPAAGRQRYQEAQLQVGWQQGRGVRQRCD